MPHSGPKVLISRKAWESDLTRFCAVPGRTQFFAVNRITIPAIRERKQHCQHLLGMAPTVPEQAARLRTIAAQFRAHAAQTEWPAYRTRMLVIALELELEAARLDGNWPVSKAS